MKYVWKRGDLVKQPDAKKPLPSGAPPTPKA